MSKVGCLRKDSAELLRLAQLSESENVKRILSVESDKLKQLADLEERMTTGCEAVDKPAKPLRSATYTTKIINYAWDQSDKFVKIYVTISDVHTFPADNVVCEFGKKSLELQVLGLEKQNHALTIKRLLNEIVPSDSYHKVKTDMIVLYMKKASSSHWPCVTESEQKAKEPKAPKLDKEEDPSQSLMTLMKQMYDDGDDEMKRTITKAWTEAREKKNPDDMMM